MNNTTFQIRISDELLKSIKATAESKGLTASAWVKMILIEKMKAK